MAQQERYMIDSERMYPLKDLIGCYNTHVRDASTTGRWEVGCAFGPHRYIEQHFTNGHIAQSVYAELCDKVMDHTRKLVVPADIAIRNRHDEVQRNRERPWQ